MYRDDRSAVRARLEAARDARADVERQIRERLDAVAALNEQLERKGQNAERILGPRASVTIPENLDTLSLADELRLCDELERETTRLTAELERLSQSVALLNDRAQGRAVREPLGPPPRDVPAQYLLAELATWYGAFTLTALALGTGMAGSDLGASALGPIALCLVMTLFRPWALEFRFLGVLILHVSIGLLSFAMGAWLAERAVIHAHPVLSLAAGALLVIAVDAGHALRRRNFLARCKVATARLIESDHTGSTYKSWPLPYGRGWESGVESYSGSGTRSTVLYSTDEGYEGRIVVKGAPWEDAVVLYDPDRPARALPVFVFGCGPRPSLDGKWRVAFGGWRTWRVFVWCCALGAVFVALMMRA